MDHSLYILYLIIVCLLAGAFGLLHGIAALSQWRKDLRPSHWVMLLGCLGVLGAVIACLAGGWFDWALMAIGGGLVCGSAFWHGKSAAAQAGDKALFHLSHHLIRFALVLILALNFVRI